MTLAEYIAQQWEILREYGLIKGEAWSTPAKEMELSPGKS